jgi:hypothetical protein
LVSSLTGDSRAEGAGSHFLHLGVVVMYQAVVIYCAFLCLSNTIAGDLCDVAFGKDQKQRWHRKVKEMLS